MQSTIKILFALLISTALSGCANGTVSKEQVGGVVGGIAGAVLGSQFGSGTGKVIASAVGGVAGYWIGTEIGKSLDRSDQLYLEQASKKAHDAPIGETIQWENPESGNRGSVTPRRAGRSSDGRYCREYETTIYVDGWEEDAVGLACQRADGSWEMVTAPS